ncbi:Gfo/Idh/MocA family protein [Brachybacterium hainanense]|uniref:Gfo/Idh/MocA family protein n=1 Tax=Brachybacterium hainanense TaxID=1541174 RepID=A0ABV6RI18_9MICO
MTSRADESVLELPPSQVPDPASAPPLRWGVVSPGHIADQFTATVHRATASRVVAVTSRSAQRAQDFARKHGIDAAYDDLGAMLAAGGLDAVYIASPMAQHHAMARQALEADVPVLLEKAFTLNAAEAEDLVGLARERGLFLMEALWARFLPQFDVLRQVLASGIIGDVVMVQADHGQAFPEDPSHRLHAPELGGGALLDLGVYPVSFAQLVLGDLQDLAAIGEQTSLGVDASVAMVARGARGGYATLSTTLRGLTPIEASVTGTLGRVRLSSAFFAPGELRVELRDGRCARFSHPGVPGDGLVFEAAEAARCIAAGLRESPLMTWADTISVMRSLDQARAALGVVFPGEAHA